MMNDVGGGTTHHPLYTYFSREVFLRADEA